MAFLDCFEEEMQTTVKIQSTGPITSHDSAGQPVYGSPVVKFNDLAGFGQLSANEIFKFDRIGNPSTHKIILDPVKITGKILPGDTAIVTKNGVEETYDLFNGENALDLDDVFVAVGRISR